MFKPQDMHLGKFVYCKQHLRPHSTGWCTAETCPEDKIPLTAQTEEEAYAEARTLGFKIYGENK